MGNMEISFLDDEFIVSKTDLSGKITYGNDLFIRMSGYTEKELLGAPHNILRHSDMPKLIFTLLWEQIKAGKEIFAYVKNKTKQEDYYWVFAHVTPSLNGSGKVIGYHSVRRKPNDKALQTIIPLYEKLLEAERSGGVNSSLNILEKTLANAGKSYDQFIIAL